MAEVLAILETNPLYTGTMPRTGKAHVGPHDQSGARSAGSPTSRLPLPANPPPSRTNPGRLIPQTLLDLWNAVADYPAPPQACLVNWYGADSRLGLHIDADETAKDAPVVSVSPRLPRALPPRRLERTDPTSSMRLASGDVVVLGGKSRRAYHGVDRIYPAEFHAGPRGGAHQPHASPGHRPGPRDVS